MLGLVLALASLSQSASAQGGGGGMGGRGRGGGRGGRPGGDASRERGPNSGDVAKEMEDMASLDKALHDVPDLGKPQKDSLKAIERTYEQIFKSYAIVARNKVDSARASGGPPDVSELRTLRQDADSVRTGEFTLARAVLATEPQRGRFDQNVAEIRAKREEQMRRQRGSQ
ncbi:MAG: hypothetical protein ABI664_22715 [bacterium]